MAALAGVSACERSPQVNAAPKPPAVTVVAVTQRSVPVYGQYVGPTEARVAEIEVHVRLGAAHTLPGLTGGKEYR